MAMLVSPALLMIDFQRDFCERGGYADQHGGVEWVQEILPSAVRLLEAARKAGIPVIHTREGYTPDLSDCDPLKLERSRKGGCEIGSEGPLGRLLVQGVAGHDFTDSLRPLKGEVVIDKAGYCAFRNTCLLDLLRKASVHELLLAGVTADVCVHTTLRSATEYGFRCFYVKDAISTFDAAIRRECERMVEVEGGVWGCLTTVESVETMLGTR